MKTLHIFFFLISIVVNYSNPQKSDSPKPSSSHEFATFGTGCFWCTEAVFRELKGVISVTPGYSGGHVRNPSYREVCTGTTGHAEVCHIEFDPSVISFKELLEVFWEVHDPTTYNRQGNDVGPQYRSVVFYHNDQQKREAEYWKTRLNEQNIYGKPVITEISPLLNFYPAEDYHKEYYRLHGDQPYCQIVIKPKVEKFRNIFRDKLKDSTVR